MIDAFNQLLSSPLKVFWICLSLVVLMLLCDGSVFRLWNLHHDQERISENIKKLEKDFKVLDSQFIKANDPEFLEQQARDRLDLASDDELIFVFSDN